MRVAVLGAGPAGLLAAHQADLMGCEIRILSRGRLKQSPANPVKSKLYGAQYLHSVPLSPLFVGLASHSVEYELRGTAQKYREKVYGESWQGYVSPEEFQGSHMAWDIREAYERLWNKYREVIEMKNIQPETVAILSNEVDIIVSTIPSPMLCYQGHGFSSESVWAIGDAPELDVVCPVRPAAWKVVCNGTYDGAWYRASNIFGHVTAEWPRRARPPLPGIAEVVKPLTTNCNCFPEVVRGGRYGKWQKGVLSDSIVKETIDAIQEFARRTM